MWEPEIESESRHSSGLMFVNRVENRARLLFGLDMLEKGVKLVYLLHLLMRDSQAVGLMHDGLRVQPIGTPAKPACIPVELLELPSADWN